MKKFFFSLDTVLSYKEQILENLRSEHARILGKIRACEKDIDELETERTVCARELAESRLRGITISKIRTYENYLEALRLRIKRKREVLAELHRQEERKREEVVEAKKETSSIEKLKERKLEEYNKQVMKEEEQFIEEFVSTKNAMAKLNG